MTEIDENGEEIEEIAVIESRKWCFWFLPSIIFSLFANISRCLVNLFDEIGLDFHRHAMWKQSRTVDKAVVRSFREQLADL